MLTVAFTGGGTGGHIYPGLAVASYLKNLLSCRVFWIGSNSEMDRTIVKNAGIDFFGIPSGKLRRYFSLKNFFDIFRIAAAYFAARKILKKEKPLLLFSKGGFVSVPPCAAGASLKIPVFAHESDYTPGLATRLNIPFTEKLFIPYNESLAFYREKHREKITVSGNPIRPEFANADPQKGREFLGLNNNERILLVLGGSLGSREINELIASCLPELCHHYTVVHQYGEANAEDITPNANLRYKGYAYFREEMPHIIAASELVICRSGAGTIWECKALKKPMIFIPLRGSGTRGDQVENAKLFMKAGAGFMFIPGENAKEELVKIVSDLAENPEKRRAMQDAPISEKNSAHYIAEEIQKRISGWSNG